MLRHDWTCTDNPIADNLLLFPHVSVRKTSAMSVCHRSTRCWITRSSRYVGPSALLYQEKKHSALFYQERKTASTFPAQKELVLSRSETRGCICVIVQKSMFICFLSLALFQNSCSFCDVFYALCFELCPLCNLDHLSVALFFFFLICNMCAMCACRHFPSIHYCLTLLYTKVHYVGLETTAKERTAKGRR